MNLNLRAFRGNELRGNGLRLGGPLARRMSLAAFAGCALLTWSLSAPLAAQSERPQGETAAPDSFASDDAGRRWFLGLGGGLLSTGDGPSGTYRFDSALFGGEQGAFDANYESGGDASSWELSFGLHLREPLALGFAWTSASVSAKAAVAGRIPHPFFFERLRTVAGRSGELSRDETALHFSLMWLVRDRENLQIALLAGPSWIDVEHDLVVGVRVDQTYPFDTATYAGAESRAESDSAIGYHVGVDAAWYFSRSVGVGGIVRYSDASIDLDAPGGAVAVGGGGLHTAAGLRFRF